MWIPSVNKFGFTQTKFFFLGIYHFNILNIKCFGFVWEYFFLFIFHFLGGDKAFFSLDKKDSTYNKYPQPHFLIHYIAIAITMLHPHITTFTNC